MNEIKKICKKIFSEFKQNHLQALVKDIFDKRLIVFGQASIPEVGYTKSGGNSRKIPTVNLDVLQNSVNSEVSEFKNQELLNEFIIQINKQGFYNFGDTDLDSSLKHTQSAICNLICGFIVRVLELEQFKFEMDEKYFDIPFDELEIILHNNDFEYKTLVGLYGVEGEIEVFNYGNISIKKATKEISDLFCYHYYESDLYHEMLEGDYYLEIKRKAKKADWQQELNTNGRNEVNKAIELVTLSGSGNIERGKSIRISNDWSILKTKKESIRHRENNSVGKKNNFKFVFDEQVIECIKEYYDCLYGKNSDILNESSILLSKKRMINAKKENDINDRIVELSLALEYSIKTDKMGISKALREKSAVLFNYTDLTNYNKTKNTIRKFYELRGDIIHGKKEIEFNDSNINLIKDAETIIRKNLLLLIKLNKKYTINEIDNKIKQLFNDDPKTPLSNNLSL